MSAPLADKSSISFRLYSLAVVLSVLTAWLGILGYGVYNDLRVYSIYHNSPDDYGQKLHFVDLKAVNIDIAVMSVLLFMFLITAISWGRYFKKKQDKFDGAVISVVTYIIGLPVLGMVSFAIFEALI